MQACARSKTALQLALTRVFLTGQNFGRSAMQLPPETVYAQTLYQIGAWQPLPVRKAAKMRYVNGLARRTTRREDIWGAPSPERVQALCAIQHWFSFGWQEAS